MKRRRNDGTFGWRVEICIRRKGKVIFREYRTFDKRQQANDWAIRREAELKAPGALQAVQHRGITVGQLLKRYVEEFGAEFGRSKVEHLKLMQSFDLADLDAIELTSSDLVNHITDRRKAVSASTANNDLVWLRVVFRAARSAWNIPVDVAVVDDAADACRRQRLVARSKHRNRRPSLGELDRLLSYASESRKGRKIPMHEVILFAVFSGRRQGEITRLRWDLLDEKNRSGVVTDMKHPREKSDQVVYFTDEAWAIIQRQPKTGDRIFPYYEESISTRFTEYCAFLGIQDLRFHDLRHECISWLFERGWDIPRVAAVSGHRSWSSLQRYTHLRRQDPYDKYEGWGWRP